MLESTRPIGETDASGENIVDSVGLLIDLRGRMRDDLQGHARFVYPYFMLILVPSLNKIHEVFKGTLRIVDVEGVEPFVSIELERDTFWKGHVLLRDKFRGQL